jgi:hypothetical protein
MTHLIKSKNGSEDKWTLFRTIILLILIVILLFVILLTKDKIFLVIRNFIEPIWQFGLGGG